MASPEAMKLKQRFVAFAARLSGGGTKAPTLADMRALFPTFADITPKPAGVTWTEIDAGGVPSLWADTAGVAMDRALLYLHGGGYVLGNAHGYRHLTGHLA